MTKLNINPELDLYFERIVDVPPVLVWKAWTVPEHVLSIALENRESRG